MIFLRRVFGAGESAALLCCIVTLLSASLSTSTALASSSSPNQPVDTSINPILFTRQVAQLELSQNGQCGNKTKGGMSWRCPQNKEEQVTYEWGKTSLSKGNGGAKCCSETGFCGGTDVHCGKSADYHLFSISRTLAHREYLLEILKTGTDCLCKGKGCQAGFGVCIPLAY